MESSIFGANSFVFYLLAGVTCLLLVYQAWFMSLRKVKLTSNIPGYTPLPFIGNLHKVIAKNPTEFVEFLRGEAEKFGNVAKAFIGSRLAVVVMDPRDVEVILGSQVHLEKSQEYDLFKPWLGDGLLISKGAKWRADRKLIAPTFHQSILKTFMPVFNRNAQRLVRSLKNEVGKEFDIHEYMGGTTTDVLLGTYMLIMQKLQWVLEEPKRKPKAPNMRWLISNIFHLRHYKPYLFPDFIFNLTKYAEKQKQCLNIIHSMAEKVIGIRKREYFKRLDEDDVSLYDAAVKSVDQENDDITNDGLNYASGLKDDLDDQDHVLGEKKRLAFLDYLIEASQTKGNILSKKDVKDQVNTIMFEGHDTTAAASSFVLCLLGVHQDIQERVYQELMEILQDSERLITFNDVLSMEYLHRVILETLRLYPPVPAITRVVREDVKLVSGDYIIPKDTTVVIGTFMTHRNAEYYPNPEKFDPDNFLPERCQSRHHYSFIPFSAGPRSCVGRKYAMLKLKVLLAEVLRNFKVKSPVEEKDFKLQGDLILKRSDGFRLIVEERKKVGSF